MRHRSAWGLLLVVLIGITPTAATHFDEPPLIYERSTSGNEAISLRLTTPEGGGDWFVGIRGDASDTRMVGYGIFFGSTDGGHGVGAQWSDGNEVTASSLATGELVSPARSTFSDDFLEPTWGVYGDDEARIVDVVLIATNDRGTYTGRFVVGATDGATIEEVDSSPAALMHAEMFQSAAHAHAMLNPIGSIPFVGCTCAYAGGTIGGVARLEITESLFGWYSPGDGAAWFTGPDGLATDGTVFRGAAPGAYEFNLAAVAHTIPPILMTADVATKHEPS